MKHMTKKRFAGLLAILVLLAAAVGGTIAYLIDSTDPLVNTFTPAEVNVHVTDKVVDNVKQNVVITNTGTTDAYIRARIVANWVDEDGIVVQAWDPANDGTFAGLPGGNWQPIGDFYYYKLPVAPGEATATPLFTTYTLTKTVEGAHLEMDVLAQAIQAEGGAVEDVWPEFTPAS